MPPNLALERVSKMQGPLTPPMWTGAGNSALGMEWGKQPWASCPHPSLWPRGPVGAALRAPGLCGCARCCVQAETAQAFSAPDCGWIPSAQEGAPSVGVLRPGLCPS